MFFSNVILMHNKGYTKMSAGTRSGLIGYWSFDSDFKENIYNLSPTTSSAVSLNADALKKNSAYFNGGSKLQFSTPSYFLNNNDVTVSGWFKSYDLSGTVGNISYYRQIFQCYYWRFNVSTGHYGIEIGTSGNKLRTQWGGGASSVSVLDSSTTFNTNTWYHFAFIFQKSVAAKIYINGALNNQQTGTSPITWSTNSRERTTIGFASYVNDYDGALIESAYLNGLADEIGYWNRALSATEVTELYGNGKGAFY